MSEISKKAVGLLSKVDGYVQVVRSEEGYVGALDAVEEYIADLEARAEKAEAMVEKLNSWVEKLMDVGWGMWRESNFGGHETLNEIRWEQLANIISMERER
jgi:hypothetical protein